MIINATEFYILILVKLTLTLIQGHISARKQNILWQLSSIDLDGNRTVLRFVSVMNLMLILFHPFKRENLAYMISLKRNNFNIVLYSGITDQFLW